MSVSLFLLSASEKVCVTMQNIFKNKLKIEYTFKAFMFSECASPHECLFDSSNVIWINEEKKQNKVGTLHPINLFFCTYELIFFRDFFILLYLLFLHHYFVYFSFHVFFCCSSIHWINIKRTHWKNVYFYGGSFCNYFLLTVC